MVERGSLRAQRFLTAIDLYFPEHLEDVSRSLWTRVWSKVRNITLYFLDYLQLLNYVHSRKRI